MILEIIYLISLAKGQDYGLGLEIPPYSAEEISPLEEYVHRPDPHFKYERHAECEEQTLQYTGKKKRANREFSGIESEEKNI